MSLLQALMNSHNLTLLEASNFRKEMRQAVKNGADPEEVLYEYGLELDYFEELIDY